MVSSHIVSSILRHEDIEWDVQCLITSPKPHLKVSENPKDIEKLLTKYERVFGDLPPRKTIRQRDGAYHSVRDRNTTYKNEAL